MLFRSRTDNTTVSDEAADQLYTGGLSNSGEQLTLRNAIRAVVAPANAGADASMNYPATCKERCCARCWPYTCN